MAATSTPDQVDLAPSEPSRPTLWQNRTFLAIWAGHSISILGDGFNSVALGLWVLQTTGSASAMAVIMTVRTLVSIFLGPIAGTFVDRADRRRVMIATDLVRVVLVGLIAYLVRLPGSAFWGVVVLSGLTALFSQFFSPAFQSSLANIVRSDDIPRASGLLQMTNMLCMVAGPLLGGTVVALFGGWAALTADAASFLISGLLILAGGAFASPRVQAGGRSTFWSELKEGIAYIAKEPLIRSIVTIAPIVNLFANAIAGVLVPVIAVRIWRVSSVQFGALEGFFPLGFAIGAGLYTAFSAKVQRRGNLIGIGGLIGSVALAVVALAPSGTAALPIYLVCGMAIALPNVIFQVMLQSEVPLAVQGRVFGTFNSLCAMATPLAFMLAGVLSDRYNPIVISTVSGCLLVLTMVGAWIFSPDLRRYR